MHPRYPIPGLVAKYPDLALQFTVAIESVRGRECDGCAERNNITNEFMERARRRQKTEELRKRLT